MICAECRVNTPHEHRCLEMGCSCVDCHPTPEALAEFEASL